MTTTSKVLIALASVAAAAGGGWSLWYYKTWEVSRGRHKDWEYVITRKQGDFMASVGRVGFGKTDLGARDSKAAALDLAIGYIDEQAGPGETAQTIITAATRDPLSGVIPPVGASFTDQ